MKNEKYRTFRFPITEQHERALKALALLRKSSVGRILQDVVAMYAAEHMSDDKVRKLLAITESPEATQ
jgi:hypothetical protein